MCVGRKANFVENHRGAAEAVFPVGEIDGEGEGSKDDDLLCAPCGDEEEALVPAILPAVYQPTHSEYLDHCVTHYPSGLGASIAWKDVAESLGMRPTAGTRMSERRR